MTTTVHLGDMTVEAAATQAAGNWRNFDSFVWWRERELNDPLGWMIHYTHHRDSGLLDQSNAARMRRALGPFTHGDDPDVVVESHDHWAVGQIDGFSLRVYRDGQVTEAFRAFHTLMEVLAAYPVLDESDYSARQSAASLENIDHAAWSLKRLFVLPQDWQSRVFEWLNRHRPHALENTDDYGGWPDDDDLRAAFEALGFERRDEPH
jgi:hypothetical protein